MHQRNNALPAAPAPKGAWRGQLDQMGRLRLVRRASLGGIDEFVGALFRAVASRVALKRTRQSGVGRVGAKKNRQVINVASREAILRRKIRRHLRALGSQKSTERKGPTDERTVRAPEGPQ